MLRAGHEVYVLLEGVFELDHPVDELTVDGGGSTRVGGPVLVRVRAPDGTRITLPAGLVAAWDVEAVPGVDDACLGGSR